MKNKSVLKTTQTALFLALLILFQYFSKPLGQFVTGSLVNFILIASTLMVGLYSGLIVAAISPILATALGIGPAFIQIVPFIALGNIVIVLVYDLICRKQSDELKGKILGWICSIIGGAVLKFLVLYFGIVKLALPFIPGVSEKQVTQISATFSWPQLVTALSGGVLAFIVVPLVQRAIKSRT